MSKLNNIIDNVIKSNTPVKRFTDRAFVSDILSRDEAKQHIKDLMLELVDEVYKDIDEYPHHGDTLRKKINEL